MDKIFLEIKDAMRKQGVTEDCLEIKTKIPQSTIHRIINNKNKKIDLPKIRIIQDALGLVQIDKENLLISEPANRAPQPKTIVAELGEEYCPVTKIVAGELDKLIRENETLDQMKLAQDFLEFIRSKQK